MKTITIVFLVLFWVVLVADCFFIINEMETSRVYTKTFLIPILISALFVQTGLTLSRQSKLYLASALLFSFGGDLLLLQEQKVSYFVGGLILFLIAHIFYIRFFLYIRPIEKRSKWLLTISATLVIGYIIFLLTIIWPNLEQAFAIAVTTYSFFIGLMLVSAINTVVGRRMKKLGYLYFIPGALLFAASDSLLAINKFNGAFAYSGILIMISYGAAQFLFTIGGIKIIKN